jgi:hypothetical protein
MHKSWIAIVALAALAAGCTDAKKSEQAAANEARKAEWVWLETAKKNLDAKRQEVTALEAQAAAGADVAAQLDVKNQEVDKAEELFGGKLATYINDDPPVVGEPMKPEQLAAMRMKSAEDILIAKEFIALGGDYRKAIDILNSSLAADPDNPALKSELADAEAKRFMSEARFAAIKKGMTETEVKAALGLPLAKNMKHYPEKKIVAWFYPKNESGDAAGIWFNEKQIAYQVNFNAVKVSEAK